MLRVPGETQMSELKQTYLVFESTAIKAVSYDHDKLTLLVIFKNNGMYTYHEVPAQVFEELRKTDSIGRFVATQIKPFYKFTKEN